MAERLKIEPDLEFIRRVQEIGGEDLNKCYQCATCSVVCELSPDEKPFPRKEMLWAQWGLKDKLLRDPDVWLCHQCNDCSIRCPRGARPGDVLAAVRSYIYESFTFPRFMGKAMANPAVLPVLFLIPVLIIAALVGINMTVNDLDFAYFITSEEALLTEFIPAGSTELLFIGGNILIFAIAFVGLKRFWDGLQHDAAVETKMGFINALWETIKEIALHKHFGVCVQNKPRQVSHLLVFYGFFGAAATAGLALFFGTIFGHFLKLPIGIETPVDPWTYHNSFHIVVGVIIKLLGAGSGTAIFIGSIMMVNRRNDDQDDIGANAYPDYLFLQLIFWTGLTGMLGWMLRLYGMGTGGGAAINIIAYLMYYTHITVVFVLLWYMPYSKFAHMLYRTMAMIWAQQRGRVIAGSIKPVEEVSLIESRGAA